MKQKLFTIILGIAFIVLLSACNGNKLTDTKDVVATSSVTQEQQKITQNDLNDNADIATTYISFLRNNVFGDSSSYYIYDIDKDDCIEMILIDATCEADAKLYVYKYKDGELVQIGNAVGGHCSICGNSKEEGIIIHYGHQGYENIDVAKIKNNSLVITELIAMREVQDYTEFEYCIPLECSSIYDMTVLINYGGTDDYVYNTSSKIKAETIGSILNRELFIMKNDLPQIYKGAISDIETTNAYKYNWNIGDIINEDNFTNIKWDEKNYSEKAKIVTFNGESRVNPGTISIEFYVQNGAKYPLIWSFETETANINIESFIDMGMEFDSAMISAEAASCCMLILFSADAI